MDSGVFYNVYEKGLYSDIEITINGKLYKLHKFFISKSNFFKTLIDNIGKMLTDEEIKIEDVSGNEIPQKYIDNVLKWMYKYNESYVGYLIGLDDDIEDMLQYYYVIDFLQIDDSKEQIIKILDCRLAQQRSKNTFVQITRSQKKNTFLCGCSGNLSSEKNSREILTYIYENLIMLVNTNRFSDLIWDKKLGRDLYNQHIYDVFMDIDRKSVV